MRHVNPANALLACLFALAVAGCSQKSGTPDTSATSAGAAADVATREQEIAAREQELAAREAALKQEEEAAAQAKAEAEAQEAARLAEEQAKKDAEAAAAAAAAAKAAAKPAAKPATKPATASTTKPAAAAAPPSPIVVPAGTQIGVVLSANVNTKHVTVGSPVQGTLSSDLVIDGRRAAKAGATVQGTVTKSVSGSDKIGGIPSLSLRFDSLVAADGATKTINAPYSQQGVSETGKDTAKIVGGTAAGAIIGHQVSDKNGAVVGGLLGAGAGAAAAKKTGGEVKLTAGSVLMVTTQSSFEVKP
jgi:FKBP-type peptidyl-prolyl cis-trans isomerase